MPRTMSRCQAIRSIPTAEGVRWPSVVQEAPFR
ncbi:hypothetical protein Esi_0151_0030 [Ectocarpus siliculosus]|uniref:Uncharacterized protein n=1 Tax=Ectocarpus siliculosus TaxID=2880 RepID=D8LFR2_ECTSI|nr:hypothetical protein Esi_0151_0030 [Ectocarpus siliculosus]|eukprot:CBN75636.1 hypothetical protein Esi_0151_0030 [Ectocarpus siliculosus]